MDFFLLIFPNLERGIIGTIIYSLVGIMMVFLTIKMLDIFFPGVLKHQITEEKNLALALVTSATILGICIIIASAIAE